MYIKRVEIKGFWGRTTATLDITDPITILVGENGSGKTTFINLIAAALRADYELLCTSTFTSIAISIGKKDQKTSRVITISKTFNSDSSPIISYKIGKESFELNESRRRRRVYISESGSRKIRNSSPSHEKIDNFMAKYATVSWIQVHRSSLRKTASHRSEHSSESPVDTRLDGLTREFESLQLEIERKTRAISQDFELFVLQLFLYSPEHDDFQHLLNDIPKTFNLKEAEADLIASLTELGVHPDLKKIKTHFEQIEHANKILHNPVNEEQNLSFNVVSTLPFLKRTSLLIEEIKNNEIKKEETRRTIAIFIDIANKFLTNKKLIITQSGSLRIEISKSEQPNSSIFRLSSGEKQLLIQLLESTIQDQEPAIFIADEPELSLHVKWQSKLLGSLRELNPQAQLIIATHSPDIVAQFRKSVVDMRDVVHEY
tara:strand:- start:1166 stop:2458 length:1293 start_codon:yes stop_codon:yes gene_type:complete